MGRFDPARSNRHRVEHRSSRQPQGPDGGKAGFRSAVAPRALLAETGPATCYRFLPRRTRLARFLTIGPEALLRAFRLAVSAVFLSAAYLAKRRSPP